MGALLQYDSVEICYNSTAVVRDLSFSLKRGEVLGIVGESGSGKSSIVRAATGLLGESGAVSSGSIRFRDRDIQRLSESEMQKIRGAEIGMIFQNASATLCPVRTVGAQVFESMRAHMKISRDEAKAQCLELFAKLNLEAPLRIWESYPFELSGGMNQRVAIAAAMLMSPAVLLADEPTSALDVSVQKQLVAEMLQLRDLFGTAIIIVTHDIGLVSAMADAILVLHEGNVAEYGAAADILNAPKSDYTRALLRAVPRIRRA